MHPVFRESRILIDGAVQGIAQLIVLRGRRQIFDLVHDRINAVERENGRIRLRFQSRANHLAGEFDGRSTEREIDVIEYGIKGKNTQLVVNFVSEVRDGLVLGARCGRFLRQWLRP